MGRTLGLKARTSDFCNAVRDKVNVSYRNYISVLLWNIVTYVWMTIVKSCTRKSVVVYVILQLCFNFKCQLLLSQPPQVKLYCKVFSHFLNEITLPESLGKCNLT